MNHTIPILFIAAVVLFVAILGGDPRIALTEREIRDPAINHATTSIDVLRVSASHPSALQSRYTYYTIGTNRDPFSHRTIEEAPLHQQTISNWLFDFNNQPYWLRLSETPSQGLALNRVPSETKMGTIDSYRSARYYKQCESWMPTECSGSLGECSPPGFFLLI